MPATATERFAGIDLGGTKILSLVTNAAGEVLGEDVRPSLASEGRAAVLQRIQASVESALARAGGSERPAAVGVAFAGTYDGVADRVGQAPNLPGWDGEAVAAPLSGLLGAPVVVENDAIAAAWGEFTLGAGRGCRDLAFLTVSTGIGGGLVLGGRLYRGSGAAGSIGHVPLREDGPACGCGSHGCLESLASGVAIAAAGRAAVAAGRAVILKGLAEAAPLSAALVYEAARRGDGDAAAIIRQAATALGQGLAVLVNLVAPELIVIGGGVAAMGEVLLEPAVAEMQARTLAAPRARVRVVRAQLAERAGALGALMLARNAQPA